MVMRLLVLSLVCFGGVFFLTSCKEELALEKKVEDFSVKKIYGPLSDKEIGICFSAMGLSYDRFSIMIPEKCRIKLSSEKFKNGSSSGDGPIGTTSVNKGLQELMLCKWQEGGKVTLSFRDSSGSISFSDSDLEGYGATACGMIPVKKLSKEKQPIYYFAANASSIIGNSSEVFDVEDFAKKYEFAMVIYASIKE
jgi:hypothetical protein